MFCSAFGIVSSLVVYNFMHSVTDMKWRIHINFSWRSFHPGWMTVIVNDDMITEYKTKEEQKQCWHFNFDVKLEPTVDKCV
jgi:hypothetical protein